MYVLLLYYKIPWWPVQRETEGKKRGGKGRLVQFYTVETCGGRREEGHSAWICPWGGARCVRSTPVRLEGGDRREGEQRAEGGPGGAACPPGQSVELSGRLQVVSWFVCLLGCQVFVISSSSSPRPSRAEVIDQRRSDWPVSLRTGGRMVSLCLKEGGKDWLRRVDTETCIYSQRASSWDICFLSFQELNQTIDPSLHKEKCEGEPSWINMICVGQWTNETARMPVRLSCDLGFLFQRNLARFTWSFPVIVH